MRGGELKNRHLPKEVLDKVQAIANTKADVSGRLLREVRESLGLTIEEVASDTKVKVKYLTAIEDDCIESLPAKIYLRGFVQCYVKALGLESTGILHPLLEHFQSLKEDSGHGRRTA